MGLNIYPGAADLEPFSQDGANDNPIRFSVDGRIGGVFERLFYVGTDVDNREYTDVTMSIIPNPAMDIVNGEDGYSIKLKVGSTQPTEQEWAVITEGNEITLDDILDNATFLPFWVRIEVPNGAPVDTILNTSLRLEATETVA